MSTNSALTVEQVNTVSWVLGSVAIALSVGRYVIRWKVIGRFYLDDLAHLGAVVFLIATLASASAQIPGNKAFDAYFDDEIAADDALFDQDEALSFVFHLLFFFTIWSVKFAFLFFYRMLFNISKYFQIAWWSVFAYNVASFIVCVAGSLLACGGDPKYLSDWEICESDSSTPLDLKVIYFSAAAIISSDLATMLLPLIMLRGLKIPRTQRLAITVLFSLSLLSIFFDLLRIVKTALKQGGLNTLWYLLEAIVAVIVSAAPTYYSLITWRTQRLSRYGGSTPSGQPLRSTAWRSRTLQTTASEGTDDGITKTSEVQMEIVEHHHV